MEKSSSNTGGVSGLTLLTLLFIALKLTGVIDWSWWWVLAPVWGVFAILLFIGLVILIGAGIYGK